MSVGVVFDCDGTLLDSAAAWKVAENRLAAAASVQLTPDESEALATMTIPEVATYFHRRFGLCHDAAGVVRMIDEMMLDYYRYRVVARPGAVEFVRDLIRAGVRCSVASSSPQRYLKAGLSKVGLWGLFSTVLSVDDVDCSKRDPLIFRRAMQEMGTTPQLTWGVDDSAYAIQTMRTAGMATVGLFDRDDTSTFEQLNAAADVVARSFDELELRLFTENIRSA